MQTSTTLPFADGHYRFHLGLTQINELQNKCGLGIGTIYARTIKGRYLLAGEGFGHPEEGEYRLEFLLDTIRQGLIGGGSGTVDDRDVKVDAYRANQLVQSYCYPNRPLKDDWTLAAAILMASIEGFDPPASKKKAPCPKRNGRSTIPQPSPTSP